MRDFSRYLMEEHPISFHPSLAEAIGLNEAIMLQKINLWLNVSKHEENDRQWIYNSYKSWQEQLPFWSERTIRRTLENLKNLGIIVTNNFNKTTFDRTLWYSIDYEKVDEIVGTTRTSRCGQNDQMPCGQNDHMETDNLDRTIPMITTMNNNDIYNCPSSSKKFKKPTIEEVQLYCTSRQNNVDAETFINYYESVGWKVGKNPMKDWKASVRTWEKNEKKTKQKQTREEFDKSLLSTREAVMKKLMEEEN